MERMPLFRNDGPLGEISLRRSLVAGDRAAFIGRGLHAGLRLSHGVVFRSAPSSPWSRSHALRRAAIAPTPLVIRRQTNYNYGPIKFASLAALFGERRDSSSGVLALDSLFPRSIRSSLDQLRRLRRCTLA